MKVPTAVQDMLCKQLQHEDVNQRIHAVLRFGALWQFRYQVWPRMEDGANAYFKVCDQIITVMIHGIHL